MSVYNVLCVYLSVVGWGKWVGPLSGGCEWQRASAVLLPEASDTAAHGQYAPCTSSCECLCPFLYIAKGRVKACVNVTHTEFCFSWVNWLTKILLLSAICLCVPVTVRKQNILLQNRNAHILTECIAWQLHIQSAWRYLFFLRKILFRFWN